MKPRATNSRPSGAPDRTPGRFATLAFATAVVFVAGLGCGSEPPAPVAARRPQPSPIESELRGRLAETPNTELLAAARELLDGGGRLERCGPYPLYTDVTEDRLIAACGLLAERLDEVYAARYDIRPRGEPASAIVLFARAESYRACARAGGVPLGYAGYALAARGLAIFHAADQTAGSFATTLAHELTHLVNRRALGVNLPPWLAEGLADGIGDTATPRGFEPVDGIKGLEALADRLRQAQVSGKAGGLRRLVALKRGEFDHGVVSHDYEQSALLVRFLLDEPELAAGFRRFLNDFAGGEIYDQERLAADLGADWEELDRRFERWLVMMISSKSN